MVLLLSDVVDKVELYTPAPAFPLIALPVIDTVTEQQYPPVSL